MPFDDEEDFMADEELGPWGCLGVIVLTIVCLALTLGCGGLILWLMAKGIVWLGSK